MTKPRRNVSAVPPDLPLVLETRTSPTAIKENAKVIFSTITGGFYSNLIYFSLYFLCVSACAHPNVYCVGNNLAGQKKCVLHEHFCDDDWDCEDGTDEKSCTHHDTTGNVGCFGDHLWECEDKKECIDATFTCDGKEDCNDGSDELMKDCGKYHELIGITNESIT